MQKQNQTHNGEMSLSSYLCGIIGPCQFYDEEDEEVSEKEVFEVKKRSVVTG